MAQNDPQARNHQPSSGGESSPASCTTEPLIRPSHSETFSVSFQSSLGMESLSGIPTNSFRLVEKGEICFDSSITVRGKRSRPFLPNVATEIVLDPERIFNVQRDRKSVRFEIQPLPSEKTKHGFITLFALDEEAAAAVATRLPQRRTAEFEQSQRDLLEFRARVDLVTPRAFVTPALVAINVLIFLIMIWDGAGLVQTDAQVHIGWGSNFGPLTTDGQWWRLFTCMFLHFGVVHLAANMAALYDSGRVVEKLFGHDRFLLLYCFSGLAGSVASLLWNPEVNSAGASGAIFGVFGGLLAYMLNRNNRVPLTVMKQQRTTTIVFIAYSLFYGFSHEGIDNAAHLGGLVGGLAMGLLLARPLDVEQRAAAGSRRLAIAVVLGAAGLFLMSLPIKNVGENYKKEQQYRVDLRWFTEEEKQLIESMKKWSSLAQSGMASDTQIADRLERDVVERWEAAHIRMSADVLDEQSRLREQQKLLTEYIAARRDAYRLLLQGIRKNDMNKAREANLKIDAGNKTLEKLKQLNSKK